MIECCINKEKGISMNRKLLRDKILGCFNGKNVGGTLGAPLEGKNGFFDVEYFYRIKLSLCSALLSGLTLSVYSAYCIHFNIEYVSIYRLELDLVFRFGIDPANFIQSLFLCSPATA